MTVTHRADIGSLSSLKLTENVKISHTNSDGVKRKKKSTVALPESLVITSLRLTSLWVTILIAKLFL